MTHYLLAILIAFFGGMILAPIIVRLIKSLNVKQTILSYVSQHESKQGIPTMGGSIFILPACIATFALGWELCICDFCSFIDYQLCRHRFSG